MPKQVIYETKGRAREFSELACNLFDFCQHGCVYCYSPLVLHKNRGAFEAGLYPRITPLDVLKSAKQWADKGEERRVLLSFTCDPYQPIEQETMVTRKSIMALHEAGLNVTILTKGGYRSMRDFDLLTPKDAYATTLTCLNDGESLKWEKGAALPAERLYALKVAHEQGIDTWVSLEPVIHPDDSIQLAMLARKYADHYKVGRLNYHEHAEDIDWRKYGFEMLSLLNEMGAKYYFKHDLLKAMGFTSENFKQSWVCR